VGPPIELTSCLLPDVTVGQAQEYSIPLIFGNSSGHSRFNSLFAPPIFYSFFEVSALDIRPSSLTESVLSKFDFLFYFFPF